MIYEYILLDEERIAKEDPCVVIKNKYDEILEIAKQFDMYKSDGYYKTRKGLWIKSNDSDEEYVNAGKFFMDMTFNKWIMRYIKQWSMVHNLDDEDSFVEEDVLSSMKKYKINV